MLKPDPIMPSRHGRTPYGDGLPTIVCTRPSGRHRGSPACRLPCGARHSMSPPALGIVASWLARCTWPRKNGFSLNDLVLFQERLASIARSISTLLQEKVNVALHA
ncbi:hypothetical protein IE4803_PB00332 (plasmid) [Rhizobium etli bv. phaseoli str. IE4803]|nr:hypothetical protein IE4803_PB00332 [Rhizobium etli bv. phaseoli str. IE4803]